MCYVVAKNADKVGSVAIRMQAGASVVALKRAIMNEHGYEHIQVVTISRPSAYGEYAPYRFVDSVESFRAAVRLL